jgi:ABC-type dipeptide/oligopeptide/nickel transport system permease subunit
VLLAVFAPWIDPLQPDRLRCAAKPCNRPARRIGPHDQLGATSSAAFLTAARLDLFIAVVAVACPSSSAR